MEEEEAGFSKEDIDDELLLALPPDYDMDASSD